MRFGHQEPFERRLRLDDSNTVSHIGGSRLSRSGRFRPDGECVRRADGRVTPTVRNRARIHILGVLRTGLEEEPSGPPRRRATTRVQLLVPLRHRKELRLRRSSMQRRAGVVRVRVAAPGRSGEE